MSTQRSVEIISNYAVYTLFGLLLLVAIFPFMWILLSSFKSLLQMNSTRSMFWPDPFTLRNYRDLIERTDFLVWFRNSFVVATASTALSLFIGTIAAFALTRLRFLGQITFASSVLVIYLVPPTILFIPLFRVVNLLGLRDSLVGLILVYPTKIVPLVIWLMMGFFRSIPKEIDDAALIDGSSKFGTFRHILLPLAAPGLVAAMLFSLTRSWNEFIYALVIIGSSLKKTLPVGIPEQILDGDMWFWGEAMAAATLATVPIFLAYIYLHRYMIEGLTAGGVKG